MHTDTADQQGWLIHWPWWLGC